MTQTTTTQTTTTQTTTAAAPPVDVSTAAVLRGLRELPALPTLVMELMRMLEDPCCKADDLAERVGRDQALGAKVLRLANSSFYGMPRRVMSITDAAAILGLRTVGSVVTAAGVVSSIASTPCPGFDFQAFWRHSIGTALCAALLARGTPHSGVAFTAGLLHDIGRLAMAVTCAGPYAHCLQRQRCDDLPALDAERCVLGTDHAVVGALVAERWCFAPAIVEAIAGHHEPPAAAGPAATPSLADLVHVADNIVHALDLSRTGDELVPPLAMAAWSRLELTEERCLAVFEQLEAQHASVCEALLH